MASDRGSSQRIILQPICDLLRSCRVLIASGFSPRFAIKHEPKLRRSDVNPGRDFEHAIQIVANFFPIAGEIGIVHATSHVRQKTSVLRSLVCLGAS